MAIPSGTRISAAFDTSSEPFEGTINTTLAMVDAVHGDGRLPLIKAFTGDEGGLRPHFIETRRLAMRLRLV